MIKIKETKTVQILYDKERNGFWLDVLSPYNSKKNFGEDEQIFIPTSKIFQVKRGLESCVQRFYRHKTK